MLRVICLFLLLVVLSPLHVFADDMEPDNNELFSFLGKIEEQKFIPVEVMKKMGVSGPYSVPLTITTDAQGNVISVELAPNQDLSDDTAYLEVQVAKNIVWNVGNIGVEKATTVLVSFEFSLQ